jgi:hypothetical protein
VESNGVPKLGHNKKILRKLSTQNDLQFADSYQFKFKCCKFFHQPQKKLNIEIRDLKKKCFFVFVTRLVHVFKKWQLIGLLCFLNGLRVDHVTLLEEKLCFAPLQDSRPDQSSSTFQHSKTNRNFHPIYAITSGKSFE